MIRWLFFSQTPVLRTLRLCGPNGRMSTDIGTSADGRFFADTGLEFVILALSELTKFGGVSRDLVAI